MNNRDNNEDRQRSRLQNQNGDNNYNINHFAVNSHSATRVSIAIRSFWRKANLQQAKIYAYLSE